MTEKELQYFSQLLNLDSYKSFLLDDFGRNKDFADLASSVSYYNRPSNIAEWVKGIKDIRGMESGRLFMDVLIQTSSFEEDMVSGVNIVKDIDYSPCYFTEHLDDLYAFFSYRTYDTYEDAAKNYPPYAYFEAHDGLYEKLNSMLRPVIVGEGYVPTKKNKYFVKKIGSSAEIKLIPNRRDHYGMFSGIGGYRFPNIVLLVDGMEFRSEAYGAGIDMRYFLFLYGKSFDFFYRESHEMKTADGNIAPPGLAANKRDEPVIYEEDGQYIISNSVEKLAYWNKYIYIVLELYCHYFKVFEQWLTQRIDEVKNEL